MPVLVSDTVAGFVASWVAALPAEGLEPGTGKHYSEAIARLVPTIGTAKLQNLSALDLDHAYAVLLDGAVPRGPCEPVTSR